MSANQNRKQPSPAEPVTQLRRIPIKECGEPLIPFLGVHAKIIQARPRYRYSRVALARQSVVEALIVSAENLEPGYKLAVLEGWRPPHIQRRMWLTSFARWKQRKPEYSDAALRRITNQFTAPLHPKVPPPHSTGGAVDVMLADAEGKELDMTSPFEPRDQRAYPAAATGLSEPAQNHRRILRQALSASQLTNYPSEYWHWSFGDQGWCYRGNHDFALYGPICPDDYEPEPAELIEEPLESMM